MSSLTVLRTFYNHLQLVQKFRNIKHDLDIHSDMDFSFLYLTY